MVKKLITMTIISVILLALGAALAWSFLRFSYYENTAYGYTVRTDRLTDDKCLHSGSEDILKVLALDRC